MFNESRPVFNPAEWLDTSAKAPARPMEPRSSTITQRTQDVEAAVQALEAGRIDLTARYDDWISIGFALASLGEVARNFFHRVSALYGGYKVEECDRKFDECLTKYDSTRCDLRKFFYLCKNRGITVHKEYIDPPIVGNIPTGGKGNSSEEAVRKEAVRPPFDWLEPLPIETTLLPVEPMQPEMIPEPFREWLADIANRMRCPLDFVAIGAIVVTSAIVGTRVAIRPKSKDNWEVIPNLWGAIVGNPSMLKTPSLEEVMQPLKNLEREARNQFAQAKAYHEAEKVFFEQQKAVLKTKMKDGDPATIAEYQTLQAPETPTAQRFTTNDSTVEKLIELLNENPTGMLVFRDELTGLLTSWEKAGHENDRQFFLEAWNGKGAFTSDRIGRGTVHADLVCVSLLGGIQPDKLGRYLYEATQGGGNDGMIQRLQLLTFPDAPEWKYVDRYPDKEAKQKAVAVFDKLAGMDFTQVGTIPIGQYDRFPCFVFDNEAQHCFVEWLTRLETQKLRIKDETTIIVEHLAKYRSLMPSLALLFHLIELAVSDGKQTRMVSLSCTQMAVRWCNYLESHARRVYALVTNFNARAVEELAKHLRKGDLKDGFKAREIVQKGWSMLKDTATVEAAMSELVARNWLKDVESATNSMGRPAASTYRINPKIFYKS